jgi:hypothetical protein
MPAATVESLFQMKQQPHLCVMVKNMFPHVVALIIQRPSCISAPFQMSQLSDVPTVLSTKKGHFVNKTPKLIQATRK